MYTFLVLHYLVSIKCYFERRCIIKKYYGIFNWHGELHCLWTTTKSKDQAYVFFITRLANILKRNRKSVAVYFNDKSKANWEIKGD